MGRRSKAQIEADRLAEEAAKPAPFVMPTTAEELKAFVEKVVGDREKKAMEECIKSVEEAAAHAKAGKETSDKINAEIKEKLHKHFNAAERLFRAHKRNSKLGAFVRKLLGKDVSVLAVTSADGGHTVTLTLRDKKSEQKSVWIVNKEKKIS